MTRPEKIYLDEPLTIKGIKVGHTRAGLVYLVDHYQHILAHATRAQLGDNERQHLQWLIKNFQEHIELYEHYPTA